MTCICKNCGIEFDKACPIVTISGCDIPETTWKARTQEIDCKRGKEHEWKEEKQE